MFTKLLYFFKFGKLLTRFGRKNIFGRPERRFFQFSSFFMSPLFHVLNRKNSCENVLESERER